MIQKKKSRRTAHFFFRFIPLLLLLWGCASTNKLNRDLAASPVPYIIEEDFSFQETADDSDPASGQGQSQKSAQNSLSDSDEEPGRYIFIRLYNPVYKNPFYIANILKAGIEITDLNEEKVSHSAINFSLDDNFYGLTFGGKLQLVEESCVNVDGHKYMGKCSPVKSAQVTYALKVTEDEYTSTKEFVEAYAQSTKVKYRAIENFKIAMFDIKRRFFTSKKNREFGKSKYLPLAKNRSDRNSDDFTENDFVCSTFIAFALINNIPRIADWFENHKINYRYVNVGDLIHIPGMTRLFSSTWEYYQIAAQAFVDEHPEFSEYLNN